MLHLPRIHILLSTYNGEKYLEEQLDSIFKQTYQNFVLYIRDDGSSDSTVELIHEYIMKHPSYASRIIFLSEISFYNVGYMESFWMLLDKCEEADYYAFCDQDDVWLPEKLELGVNLLQKENDNSPLLYFSNYYYCDEKLHPIGRNGSAVSSVTLWDVLFYTPAFGFSMIINNKLRHMALLTKQRERLPHDDWVQKLAAAFGKIIYDDHYTALYRRHSAAVTFSNKNLCLTIANWIRNDIFGCAMKQTHYVIDRFFQEYGSMLSADDAEMLSLYVGPSESLSVWLKRFAYKKKLRPSVGGDIALRICFFLNRY